MRTTARISQQAMCVWCYRQFETIFDFLDHVSDVHLDSEVAQRPKERTASQDILRPEPAPLTAATKQSPGAAVV